MTPPVDDLERRSRALTEQFPDRAAGWKVLGSCLHVRGEPLLALPALLRAAALAPHDAQTWFNLGVTQAHLGHRDDAVSSYRRSIALEPDDPRTHNNLGLTLRSVGELEAALEACRGALALRPAYPAALVNLGATLCGLGRFAEAVPAFERALALDPELAGAYVNLSIAKKNLWKFDDALETCRRAVAVHPADAEAQHELGIARLDLGEREEAIRCFRRAVTLAPEAPARHSDLLFQLSQGDPTAYRLEAERYGAAVSRRVTSRFHAWACPPQPDRLRVGIVSGDLRNHAVSAFLEGVLPHLTGIDLFAYHNHAGEDALTERIRPYFSKWANIVGAPDADVARAIHADGIHVLIDLSGHTAHNRLPVFAWKPAPVQVSWLGWFASTGVAEIDFVLADETGVPLGHASQFRERIVTLPDTRLCFTPPTWGPVAPLPQVERGYPTFACYQNLAKVTDEVLDVWARIFAALPTARLRWTSAVLRDPLVAARQQARLARRGIAASLHGAVPREEYLASYAEIDVVLDTFPYPGGTTTCEALWMGVPTVTLAGDTLLSRQGASLLTAAGLPDWIAQTPDEYVAKAIAFSRGIAGLAALRAGLRERVRVSPLFDARRFADHLQRALWGIWASVGRNGH